MNSEEDPRDLPEGAIGRTTDEEPIYAEPGDGSLSAVKCRRNKSDYKLEDDVNESDYPNESTSASTTFYARNSKTEDQRDKFNRLWIHQHGWYDDESGRRTHRDKIVVAQALAGELGLTQSQRERVAGIVANIDGRKFSRNGGIYGLALGAIAYVRDADARTREERIVGSSRFNELCEKCGVDGRDACKRVTRVYAP